MRQSKQYTDFIYEIKIVQVSFAHPPKYSCKLYSLYRVIYVF